MFSLYVRDIHSLMCIFLNLCVNYGRVVVGKVLCLAIFIGCKYFYFYVKPFLNLYSAPLMAALLQQNPLFLL